MKKILSFIGIAIIAISLSGCSKEESSSTAIRIKNNEIKLFRGTEAKLVVENASGNIVYKSRNKNIATVSEDGVVKGNVRGVTNILAYAGGDSALCKVVVETKMNDLPEPILDFGKSRGDIKNKMPKGSEIVKDKDDTFAYRVIIKGVEIVYLYTFENGKMRLASFAFSVAKVESEDFASFLAERYIYKRKIDSNTYELFTPDYKTLVTVLMMPSSYTVMVAYNEN